MSLPLPHARLQPEESGDEAPLSIEERRCNRCGSCLKLACGAIDDLGGEALVIDEATCTGCGHCVPLCRARAIGPSLRVL